MSDFPETRRARYARLAASPWARFWLALTAFLESVISPVPPDLLLIPLSLAKPAHAFRLALLTSLASVGGGLLAYVLGLWFMEHIGSQILAFLALTDEFDDFARFYALYGVWAVLIAAFTPIPYKIVTLASGVFGLNIVLFLLASLAGRGLRFFAVAALCRWLGPPVERYFARAESRWRRLITLLAFALLCAVFTLLYVYWR